MNILTQSGVVALLISAPILGWANIDVSPMSAVVTPAGVTLLTITSRAEDVRYIQTSLKQVLNPGTKHENESPEGISSNEGVIVSPSKFVLAAGQIRKLRLVAMQLPATEKVYRLYIESLPAKNGEATVDTEKLKTEVGIDLIWGVVVHVPPLNPIIKLTLDRGTHQIVNNGNFHLKISRVGYCSGSARDNTCSWSVTNKNLYPSQKLDLPGKENAGSVTVDYYNEYKNASEEISVN